MRVSPLSCPGSLRFIVRTASWISVAMLPGIAASAFAQVPVASAQQAQTQVGVSAVRAQFRTAPRSLVVNAVDKTRMVPIPGAVHSEAARASDLGLTSASTELEHVQLLLRRPQERQAALDALVDALHKPGDPSYHQWLTPETVGADFGPSAADLATLTGFLQSEGFTVNRTSKSGMIVDFSGTAAQVQQTFQTEIHDLELSSGERRYSAVKQAQIPQALATLVTGFVSLSNISPRSQMVHAATSVALPSSIVNPGARPLDIGSGGAYNVGAQDFYTIYNEKPLFTASTPITGSGVTIALLEETDINTADVTAFRTSYGVIPNTPALTVQHGSASVTCSDPGITNTGEEGEAVLDTEWAGAVAPSATLLFMSCATASTPGTFLSAEAVIDNNLASIMSLSYGAPETGSPGTASFILNLWEQAAAQGQTVVVSAGDSGAAPATDQGTGLPASHGAVSNVFASTAYNVSAGGTDFQDLYNQDEGAASYGLGTYWNSTNAAGASSAKSYIPETTWNGSCASSILSFYKEGTTTPNALCDDSTKNSGTLVAVGGGGGVSLYNSRPSWQTATVFGLPAATGIYNSRLQPDISLFASNGIWLHALDYYQSDVSTSTQLAGGTSFVAPQLAGVFALISQKTGSRLGQPNYELYSLAGTAYGVSAYNTAAACNGSGTTSNTGTTSSAPATNCVFYDVVTSNNSEACTAGSANCFNSPGNSQYGILSTSTTAAVSAFASGLGYDLSTGLGSVNITNLVNAWVVPAVTAATPTVTLTSVPNPQVYGTKALNVTTTLSGTNNGFAPTGSFTYMVNAQSFGPYSLTASPCSGSTCTASYTVGLTYGAILPVGASFNVSSTYTSNSQYYNNTSGSATITVQKQTPTITVSAATFAVGTASTALTATINYTGTGTAPTGALSINVDSGTSVIATCTGTASPLSCSATYNTSALAAGTHTITANYTTDTNYAAATGTNTATVTGVTFGSMSFSPASTEPYGTSQAVTISDTLAYTGSVPTGSVSYALNATSYPAICTGSASPLTCSATVPAATIASLPSAAYPVTVTFAGDTTYAGMNGVSGSFTISPRATATTITSVTPDPATTGASVTVTATISPAPPNGETVTFKSNGTTIGTGTTASGIATYTTTTLATGTDAITAIYAGDTNYTTSTSTAFNTVVGAVPSFLVTSNLDDNSGTCTNQSLTGATPDAKCELRKAVAAAPALSGNVMVPITFASSLNGQTIVVGSGGIYTGNNIAINGPGAANLTISTSALNFQGSTNQVASVSGLTFVTTSAGIMVNSTSTGNVFTVSNSIFNNATLRAQNGSVTLTNTTFENLNSNAPTSPINANAFGPTNESFSINGCSFINNISSTAGTAIAFAGTSSSSGSITNSIFTGNTLTGGGATGGAIYTYEPTSTLAISNSLFANNGNANGTNYAGGGAIEASSLASLAITNSTFTGNFITGPNSNGGAIVTGNFPAVFTNVTVTGNSALSGGQGGGVVGNNVTYNNTVVEGNSATAYADSRNAGTQNSSLVNTGSSATSPYTMASLFSSLGSYGGPTQSLLPISNLLLNAGSVGSLGGATTDQRGNPRTVSGKTDIGAVESNYSLSFAQQPLNTAPGATITPSPSVQLNESGNAVQVAGPTVTLSAAAGTLSGTKTVATNSLGIAVFPGLSIATAQTADSLTAALQLGGSTTTSYSKTSSNFNIAAGTDSLGAISFSPAASEPFGTSQAITISVPLNFSNGAVPSGAVAVSLNGVSYPAPCAGSATPVICSAVVPAASIAALPAAAYPVTVTGTADSNYAAPAAVMDTFTITQIAPAITFSVANHRTGDASFQVTATSNSAGTFTYSVLSGPASVSGNTVTLTGAGGTVMLQAAQAANGNYSAGSQTASFTVASGSVWLGNNNSTLSEFSSAGTPVGSAISGGGLANVATPLASAFDKAGTIWVASSNGISAFSLNGTAQFASAYTSGGISNPRSVAVDGAGLIWAANAAGTISVLNNTGAPISPSAGYAGLASGTPGSLAVDLSGNVWLTNQTGGTVVELLGAASPVAPLSTGVTNGTTGVQP